MCVAVQEERQKNRDSEAADESHEPDTTDTTYMDMPVEQILEAELIVEPKLESFTESSNDAVTDICQVYLLQKVLSSAILFKLEKCLWVIISFVKIQTFSLATTEVIRVLLTLYTVLRVESSLLR